MSTRARRVALVTSLAVAFTGIDEARAIAPPEAESPAGEEPTPDPDEEPSPQPNEELEVELEERETPTGGGAVGAVVDPNDPNAKRAQSDLEGESLDHAEAGVPDRLPKLQAAGWWLTFGGVTLAAAGGVLGGVAETREDEADRLAHGFDFMTGTTTQFGPVEDEWNQTLREGRAFEAAARGLIIGGAAVVLAGIGLFIADGIRRKRSRAERMASPTVELSSRSGSRPEIAPGPTGLMLRF